MKENAKVIMKNKNGTIYICCAESKYIVLSSSDKFFVGDTLFGTFNNRSLAPLFNVDSCECVNFKIEGTFHSKEQAIAYFKSLN